MKYIVQDSEGKKMEMTVVKSLPQLPEGFQILGKSEDLPDFVAEIESERALEPARIAARQFLDNSDWKVTRHRDQLDAGIATSLTAEEFAQLLTERQAARDAI